MGVTLCEALTLNRPFQVPDDLPAVALAPFLARAEAVSPRVLDPELPDELADVIMKAMAKDPQRPSSLRPRSRRRPRPTCDSQVNSVPDMFSASSGQADGIPLAYPGRTRHGPP